MKFIFLALFFGLLSPTANAVNPDSIREAAKAAAAAWSIEPGPKCALAMSAIASAEKDGAVESHRDTLPLDLMAVKNENSKSAEEAIEAALEAEAAQSSREDRIRKGGKILSWLRWADRMLVKGNAQRESAKIFNSRMRVLQIDMYLQTGESGVSAAKGLAEEIVFDVREATNKYVDLKNKMEGYKTNPKISQKEINKHEAALRGYLRDIGRFYQEYSDIVNHLGNILREQAFQDVDQAMNQTVVLEAVAGLESAATPGASPRTSLTEYLGATRTLLTQLGFNVIELAREAQLNHLNSDAIDKELEKIRENSSAAQLLAMDIRDVRTVLPNALRDKPIDFSRAPLVSEVRAIFEANIITKKYYLYRKISSDIWMTLRYIGFTYFISDVVKRVVYGIPEAPVLKSLPGMIPLRTALSTVLFISYDQEMRSQHIDKIVAVNRVRFSSEIETDQKQLDLLRQFYAQSGENGDKFLETFFRVIEVEKVASKVLEFANKSENENEKTFAAAMRAAKERAQNAKMISIFFEPYSPVQVSSALVSVGMGVWLNWDRIEPILKAILYP